MSETPKTEENPEPETTEIPLEAIETTAAIIPPSVAPPEYWTVVCGRCDEETGRSASREEAQKKYAIHQCANRERKRGNGGLILIGILAVGLVGAVVLGNPDSLKGIQDWLGGKRE